MSLTGQLGGGEFGRWCAANLTGTGRLADVATSVRPVRPFRLELPDHWAVTGGAFGQRLAFATQHAPPHYALLGAHRAGLADGATLGCCAAAFPTNTALGSARTAHANQLRPLPGGGSLDLDRQPGDRYTGRSATGTRTGLVVDIVERLVAVLAEHAPPGHLAGSRGAKAVPARALHGPPPACSCWPPGLRGRHVPAPTTCWPMRAWTVATNSGISAMATTGRKTG